MNENEQIPKPSVMSAEVLDVLRQLVQVIGRDHGFAPGMGRTAAFWELHGVVDDLCRNGKKEESDG